MKRPQTDDATRLGMIELRRLNRRLLVTQSAFRRALQRTARAQRQYREAQKALRVHLDALAKQQTERGPEAPPEVP